MYYPTELTADLPRWPHTSLLGIEGLTRDDLKTALDVAARLKKERGLESSLPLKGRRVALFFVEASTRTKLSFTLAARRLGADVIDCSPASSSLQKGESLSDTARTLKALGAEWLVVRHGVAGVPLQLQRVFGDGVLNAGDGRHEHPTQALLDLMTVHESLGRLTGLNVVIVGDLLHSRVSRSNIKAHRLFGNRVTWVGPPSLAAPELAECADDLDRALPEADVVMVLRLQRERMQAHFFPSLAEYRALYGLTESRVRLLKPGAILLHPGPMNVGVEIDFTPAQHAQARILDQVTNGVYVRMALLLLTAEARWGHC